MPPVEELIIFGFILVAAAYLMGSLPFSIWIGRKFYATDVRDHGSGSTGATNTWRVLGWKAGLPVLILDIGKGLAATSIPYLYSPLGSDPDMLLWVRILCGLAAALGHIYPALAGFRGGKAVATFFGILIGLMPVPAAGILIVFIITVLLFRIISLGSMMAGLSLPFLTYFFTEASMPLMILSVVACLIVIATHRNNISRLLQGKEPRFSLHGKKRKD